MGRGEEEREGEREIYRKKIDTVYIHSWDREVSPRQRQHTLTIHKIYTHNTLSRININIIIIIIIIFIIIIFIIITVMYFLISHFF